MQAKNIVIAVLAFALIGAIGFLFMNYGEDTVVTKEDTTTTEPNPSTEPVVETNDLPEAPLEVTEAMRGTETIIGTSVAGANITARHFGTGDTEVLLVGGVHGGYSPNTTALGEELIAHFEANPTAIPANLMVTVIPNLNPDGSTKVGTAGRFNANEVDLNRNFDCEWSATGKWRSQTVSGGAAPFSEPEAAALRDYVTTYNPAAAVVWFSAEGKVYPSACGGAPDRNSVELAAAFATAAGYGAEAEFDAYVITGDMVNWMADQNIPAISVLLTNHQDTEWEKNQKGVEAVLNKYAQ